MTFLCDFDGTVATRDIGAALLARFGRPAWRLWDVLAHRGALPLRVAQDLQWRGVRASIQELRAEAFRVGRVRPGFEEFLAKTAADGHRIIVVSSGFSFYIDAVLGPLRSRVELIANDLLPAVKGFRIAWAPLRYACASHRPCKVAVLRKLPGSTVLVGDGVSDTCGLRSSATIFAVEGSFLARLASAQRRPFTAFTDFRAVV
ncbi:MAG: HAD-IB family phosphatase [Actinomycetota bacterium]|nr:HAD-IB family phosphatase [Actinomycetota bacterium]